MRVLTPKWSSASRIAPDDAVVTGEESGKETEKPVADKPMFIYVTDGSTEGPADKIEKVVLDDNKVLVGMKAFRCVKMSPGDVADDPLLSGKTKDTRYFLFVSHDYDKVEVIDDRKMKASKVYSTMKKFARKAYKTNFDRAVKDTLKLLIEYDKVNNAKKVLEEKKQRMGSEISERDAKEIDEELAELAEEQKKLEAEEKELLTFEPKKSAA